MVFNIYLNADFAENFKFWHENKNMQQVIRWRKFKYRSEDGLMYVFHIAYLTNVVTKGADICQLHRKERFPI